MSSHIYHGVWVDWSRGAILGATLTLSERSAGLLTAFIATFVTIVGAELWKIICYILHQIRATERPQDGLYHQQQVIFRNNSTPGATAWLFLQQTYYWISKAKAAIFRTLPWAIFATSYLGLFAVLAIFSSEISKSIGPERLIVSPNCGYWRLNDSDPASEAAWASKTTNDSLTAITYASACYGGANQPQCGQYIVPNINWTSNQNASCPFASGLCYYGDTAAFQMTSNVIDSHADLGINTPEHDRITVQKVTTCAPLHEKNFATISYGSPGTVTENDTFIDYNYGPFVGGTGYGIISNYTYEYNTHAEYVGFGYGLTAVSAIAGQYPTEGGWTPVDAINRTDADISLLFVSSNSIRYKEPCGDPMFAAHNEMNVSGNGVSLEWWTADIAVSSVGCAEQYKMCNPNNNKCSDLLGQMQLMNLLGTGLGNTLDLNDIQKAISTRVMLALQVTSVYYATYTRNGNALRASETVTDMDQAYLPPNQWMLEASSWFDQGLARLQAGILEYATGPASVAPGAYLWQPAKNNDPISEAMCYSQIVRNGNDTTSFSILGMGVLFGVGGFIIVLATCLDSIVGYIQHKTGKGLHARMQWLLDDKLQMQRLLFDEMKLGNWEDGYAKVPTTNKKAGYQAFVGPADRHVADPVTGAHVNGTGDSASDQLVSSEVVEVKHEDDRRY